MEETLNSMEEILSVSEDITIEEAPIIEDLIPQNNSSLLYDESTTRFSSAEWYERIQEQTVLLAGIGGIGSYVAFLLSRLKIHNLVMYDGDIVEPVNMAGQLFGTTSLYLSKVTAMSKIISEFSNFYNYRTYNCIYTEDCPISKIMICGFDNMAARSVFFERWMSLVDNLPSEEKKECLFIDGRLAAEEFQVLCITGDDVFNINKYRSEFLFSDEEADPTTCSYKQTTFMANMIGSIIVNLFVNFVANMNDIIFPRDLPFYTEYNAERMYFKTIA